ncbi:MAG: alpha/beta hydrolase [Chitinophagaceae bacterium]|nr:MAG: alpha/beta hydrolase [Chitinophagaceae bacterium]
MGRKEKEMINVSYGPDIRQRYDVWFPDVYYSTTPIVLLVHGGAFVAGSKDDFTPFARTFRSLGFVAVNIGYRLVDTTGMFGTARRHHRSKVSIRDQVQDLDSAIRHFQGSANGWSSATRQMFLAGHSAGGTLALLCSYNTTSRHDIRACANWAGGTDLSVPDDRIAAMLSSYMQELLFRAVGALPAVSNNYIYREVSPYWVISSNPRDIPVISIYPEFNQVFHYPGESEIGLFQTRQMHRLLKARQIKEALIVYKGSNHSFTGPGTREKVIAETAAFFRSVL